MAADANHFYIFCEVTMYELSKHRFKELQHFCLQYPEWKRAYQNLISGSKCLDDDPTAVIGIQRADYARNIELIERLAQNADILDAVTSGVRPDGDKTEFYILYREFFWLLDKEKGI